MLAALALILPLGLGAAISPMLFTEQTVLVAEQGVRAGRLFAAGALGTLLVVVAATVLFGRAISLPTEPRLDASLDIVVGAVLLAVAALVAALPHLPHPRRRGHHDRPAVAGDAALPFGVFSMATNFTSLALVLPAAKEISSTESAFAGRAVLVLLLVVLAGLPAWLPLALNRMAPDAGSQATTAANRLIERHGRQALLAILVAAGLYFVARGTLRVVN